MTTVSSSSSPSYNWLTSAVSTSQRVKQFDRIGGDGGHAVDRVQHIVELVG